MFASFHSRHSGDSDRGSGIRASSYAGAGGVCSLSSRSGSRNRICTISKARHSDLEPRYRRCRGNDAVRSSMEGGKRNGNQTLVGAGRSPSAARCRYRRSNVGLSADIELGRRGRRPHSPKRLQGLLIIGLAVRAFDTADQCSFVRLRSRSLHELFWRGIIPAPRGSSRS